MNQSASYRNEAHYAHHVPPPYCNMRGSGQDKAAHKRHLCHFSIAIHISLRTETRMSWTMYRDVPRIFDADDYFAPHGTGDPQAQQQARTRRPARAFLRPVATLGPMAPLRARGGQVAAGSQCASKDALLTFALLEIYLVPKCERTSGSSQCSSVMNESYATAAVARPRSRMRGRW
jgi:hypothetical protein